MLELGDIYRLNENIKSDDILKDNNDKGISSPNKTLVNKNINEYSKLLFNTWIGYIYLYDEKNKKWLWDNYSVENTKLDLKPLDDYFKPVIPIKNITCSEVKELRNNNYEYLILQGCGGNLNEWVNGITDMLKEEKIVSDTFLFDEVYSFENNNLTNMAFALNNKDINIGRLATFRVRIRSTFGAMWLSDYIDNGYIKDVNI